MIGTKYLSDVLDVSQFQRGKINLIEAPCGCGKQPVPKEKLPTSPVQETKYCTLSTLRMAVMSLPTAKIQTNYWHGTLAKASSITP